MLSKQNTGKLYTPHFCTFNAKDYPSAFETLHESDDLIKTAKELDVAYVAYSPLVSLQPPQKQHSLMSVLAQGHGWLVDDFPFKSPDDFAPDDFRRTGSFSFAS